MKISKKLDIVRTAIRSISEHRDEDGAVLAAALDQVIAFAEAEKARIDAEIKAEIDAKLTAAD